jgi:MGT family glycosyltransferase
VLHAIWDGGGNTAPQLGIARALAERGHVVTVLGNRCQEEKVEATGASFRAYSHAPDCDSSRPETDLIRDWEAKTPIGGFARVRDRLMFGPAGLFARDVLETLDERPADVVAWDYLLIGAGIAAERAGVPSATIIHTVYPLPTDGLPPFGQGLMPAGGAAGRLRDRLLSPLVRLAFAPGLKPANRARAELGLAPLASPFDQLTGADLALVLTAREFDFTVGLDLPPNVRYAGPVVPPAQPAVWESPWPPDDDRPLVLVSLSTTYMDQQGLAQRLVEALAALPVRGLVTTGPAIDGDRLPRADNVEIRGFVPHAAVLGEAGLVVTHAGMGTVHAALAAGVPMVCLPGGRDQGDVAARVAHHGAGLRGNSAASSRKLRELIGRALGDPELRAGAGRMARALAGQDGAARGADELEALGGG